MLNMVIMISKRIHSTFGLYLKAGCCFEKSAQKSRVEPLSVGLDGIWYFSFYQGRFEQHVIMFHF